MPSPAAVAFDLDGTLVDTVPARIRAWRSALREAGIDSSRASVAALIGSDGRHVARMSAEAAGRELDEKEAEAIDRRQGALFEILNADPRPLPGSQALLKELDARGIPWAIATSSRPEQVGASVESLQLRRRPTIVDGGDVARAKPAPDLLLKAARVLGVDAAACWYVGDSTWDVQAARSAKMLAIGVTAGSAVSARELRAGGASVVCKGLRELIVLLPGS